VACFSQAGIPPPSRLLNDALGILSDEIAALDKAIQSAP